MFHRRYPIGIQTFSEMKVSGTAREALEQIDSKNYALPFKAEDREVVKIGVKFNKDTRTPEEWVISDC